VRCEEHLSKRTVLAVYGFSLSLLPVPVSSGKVNAGSQSARGTVHKPANRGLELGDGNGT